MECADSEEIKRRLHTEVSVTRFEARMGKLRVLSGQQVCRILERYGFQEGHRRGSHVVMQRRAEEGSVTVPVPDHWNSPWGHYWPLLRQSGVARSAFES